MKRNLTLNRETLTELSADDLTAVAGAGESGDLFTCPVLPCLADMSVWCETGR